MDLHHDNISIFLIELVLFILLEKPSNTEKSHLKDINTEWRFSYAARTMPGLLPAISLAPTQPASDHHRLQANVSPVLISIGVWDHTTCTLLPEIFLCKNS